MMGIAIFGGNPVTITVAPNPTNEWCAFRFSEPARASGEVVVYDSYGRVVLKQAYPPLTSEVQIQTNALAEGIYFGETELGGQKVKTQFSVVR